MTKPIQPFLVKVGNKTVFQGTRRKCMIYMKRIKGDKVVKNPKYGWIK